MKFTKTFLLFAACALPFTSLIVSGLSVFLLNRNEIDFGIADIWVPLTGIFLTMSAVLYLILLLTRRFTLLSGILTGLLAGMALAVWVQSQLLVWNFGHFNGQDIDWEKWQMKIYIDGIVWLLIIGSTVFIFLRKNPNLAKSLVSGIYLLGLMSVIICFHKAPEKMVIKIDESSFKDVFTFHPEKNVLIIMLDDFQSDYFQYAAKEDSSVNNEFDGFTFYRNTISRFPTTKTSLPSFFTGSLYRNDNPYKDYIYQAYTRFNLAKAYKEKSYSTRFVGQLQLFPEIIPMPDLVNNMNHFHFSEVLEYLDYGIFKALPTFFKPVIFNKGNWFFSFLSRKQYPPEPHGSDVRFLELFEKNASVKGIGKGTFKFFHFHLPHFPLNVDRDLKFNSHLAGVKGYHEQTKGAILLAKRILKTLKRIGIYDKSEIIILSDHGTGAFPALSRNNVCYDALNLVPPCVQSASLALLMHKPAYAKGKMITLDIPLELTDLPCILGLKANDSTCDGYRKAMSGEKRDRTFYYYEWSSEYWDNDFLPPMTEYIVTGPAYDPDSYIPGTHILTEKGIQDIPISNVSSSYTLGKEIDFSTLGKGEADGYIRAGWSPAENSQMWSNGPIAGLSLHLNRIPQKDLALKIFGFAYLGKNKIKCQVVSLLVNQVPIGRWLVKEGKVYEAVIPGNVIKDKNVNIVFKISNPMSPADIDKSPDVRKLGIALVKMVLDEVK